MGTNSSTGEDRRSKDQEKIPRSDKHVEITKDLAEQKIKHAKFQKSHRKPKEIRKRFDEDIEVCAVDQIEEENGLVIIPILKSVEDLGSDYEIFKLQLCHSFNLYKNYCHSKVHLLGLYGLEEDCRNGIRSYLSREDLPEFKIHEGIIFAYDREQNKGILSVITTKEEYFTPPITLSNKFIAVLRIVADVCNNMIACISNQQLVNWYFSERPNELHPYIPQSNFGEQTKIHIIRIDKSEVVEHKIANKRHLKNIVGIINDENFFGIADIGEISITESALSIINEIFTEFIKEIREEKLFKASPIRLKIISMLDKIEESLSLTLSGKVGFADNLSNLIENRISSLKTMSEENRLIIIKLLKDTLGSKEYEDIENVIIQCESYETILDIYTDNDTQNPSITMKAHKNAVEKLKGLDNERDIKIKELNYNEETLLDTYARSQNRVMSNISIYKINKVSKKWKIERDKMKIQINLEGKYYRLAQLIKLHDNYMFAVFSSVRENSSAIYKCRLHEIEYIDTYFCKVSDPSSYFASGSTLNSYFLVLNNNKEIRTGSVNDNSDFMQAKKLQIFSKYISVITSIHYMEKSKRLIMLNQDGEPFVSELKGSITTTQIKIPKKTSDSKNTFEPLKSKCGQKYLEVKCTQDEKAIIFLTEKNIEILDVNYSFLIEIPLNISCKFNTSMLDISFLLISYLQDDIKAFEVTIPQTKSTAVSIKAQMETIRGNPIADMWHLSITKFGSPILKTYVGFYHPQISEEDMEKVKYYFRKVRKLYNSYKFSGIFNDLSMLEVSKSRLSRSINQICMKVPLHIAIIENSNLVPLRNGVNRFSEFMNDCKNENFANRCKEYIKFSQLEDILEQMTNVKVISIIGKQSGGKSYLLNKIFCTLFNVTAQRCTQGLWMSLSEIDGHSFLILDCEGLFTPDRSVQDEMKLCLFLTAVSDVMIINTDLANNRAIFELFSKLSLGIDRLKGENLFKGIIDFAIRDVADNQAESALEEINNFITKLRDQGHDNTFVELFQGSIEKHAYHFFENRLFDEETICRRNEIISNIPVRWERDRN